MSKLILTLALTSLLACNTDNGPGFGMGTNGDDTDADDTGPTGSGDCPPSFGEIAAAIDDYPGKGWVVEVTAPFTEGTCSVADGELYLEFEDGTGTMVTEGPFEIGFEDEAIYIENYEEEAGTGELFFAFPVDSSSDQVIFTMWVKFTDGSSSEHVEVTPT
jgi:hypothetical protein